MLNVLKCLRMSNISCIFAEPFGQGLCVSVGVK